MTGGTCVANKVLGAGQSCSYALQLKAGTKGGAVRTNFTITGAFAPHVCPAGDHQVITVNLAGDIILAIAGKHMMDRWKRPADPRSALEAPLT